MREMQTQATVSYQLTPLGKVSVRKTEAEKHWQEVAKGKHSLLSGRNVNAPVQNSMEHS